jgi:hypothetical protein
VYTDVDVARAVTLALDAARPDRADALTQHSWQQRLATLLTAAGLTLIPSSDSPVKVVQRPVTHHAWNHRHVKQGP